MALILPLFSLIAVSLIFAAQKIKQRSDGSVGFPYQFAEKLFSAAEQSFLGVLDQMVRPEH